MGDIMILEGNFKKLSRRVDKMTIKELRERYNLTQSRMSEITGVPLRTIENWDEGIRKPAVYIPGLIEAKIKLYIAENGGTYMTDFNINKECAILSEYINAVQGRYLRYLRKEGIHLNDKTNPYVAAIFELQDINNNIYKIKNEEDFKKADERVREIRAFLKE